MRLPLLLLKILVGDVFGLFSKISSKKVVLVITFQNRHGFSLDFAQLQLSTSWIFFVLIDLKVTLEKMRVFELRRVLSARARARARARPTPLRVGGPRPTFQKKVIKILYARARHSVGGARHVIFNSVHEAKLNSLRIKNSTISSNIFHFAAISGKKQGVKATFYNHQISPLTRDLLQK